MKPPKGNAILRLRSLRVSDAMTKSVVQVAANQTLGEVAKSFAEHQISSAPVVDEQGRCMGILSATDFLNHDAPSLEQQVASYMTAAVKSIAPVAPLLTAAATMCAQHIHRLPVLDEYGRVVGMLSTMDIVAALLNAIEEMDAGL
jgi:CBS domain-containing membrane protein